MSKIGHSFIATVIACGMAFGVTGISQVSAASIDLGPAAPQSGALELNDQDEIANASDVYFGYKLNAERLGISNRTAHNYARGRWVYYSDHRNIFNGYKWVHSNTFSKKYHHGAYAAVSKTKHSGHWVYANAGKWAYCTAKGYGTAIVKYTFE